MTGPPSEVADGVFRLGTERLNWYLVAADDGVAVVDTGLPAYKRELEPALSAIGRGPADVRAIVLTHCHPDHMGGTVAAQELTGAPIMVHEADEQDTLEARTPKAEGRPLPYLRRRSTAARHRPVGLS